MKNYKYYNSKTNKLYSGEIELEYFLNGDINKKMFILDGKISLLTIYWANGKIKREYSRRKGVYTYNYDKKYYMDGSIKEELIYEEWNLEYQSYISYFENGKKKIEIDFFDNGDKNIEWIYNELGQMISLTRYYENNYHKVNKIKNNKTTIILSKLLSSNAELYPENNKQQIKLKNNYQNKKYCGKQEKFYEDGLLSDLEYWNNGKEVGEWKSYHKNGSIAFNGHWNNGIKNSRWVYYYENKMIKSESYWDNGKKIGTWTKYYPNGKKSQKIYNSNDNGQSTVYFNLNGQKTTKEEMKYLMYEMRNKEYDKEIELLFY